MPLGLLTSATLLSTPIGELWEWGLLLWCACRQGRLHVPLAPIADRQGSGHVLEEIASRLRYQRCGKPPSRIEAQYEDPFAERS